MQGCHKLEKMVGKTTPFGTSMDTVCDLTHGYQLEQT